MLFPDDLSDEDEGHRRITCPRLRKLWAYAYPFVTISLTPVECSIACPQALARQLFEPVRNSLDEPSRSQVNITKVNYLVLQVEGEGLDAGRRVLELTTPLAMAKISIFFVTTYFADYILVPATSRLPLIQALHECGFVLCQASGTFVNTGSPSLHAQSPTHAHYRSNSASTVFPTSERRTIQTGQPAAVSELQTRTLKILKEHGIQPQVDQCLRLIQCAGRKDISRPISTNSSASNLSGSNMPIESGLHLGLVRALISQPPPKLFSLTLTDTEPASLLLEQRLLSLFSPTGDMAGAGEVLLGVKSGILTPIIFDLRKLSIDSVGIVCGVAGILVGATDAGMEMSYLSTARAGTVIVAEEESESVMEALRVPLENGT